MDAELTWIGPGPEAIRRLGDKVEARRIAEAVGAPLVPGSDGPVADAEAAEAFSRLTRPDHTHHAFLAAALGRMGDGTAAAAHAAEVARREPGFSAERYLATLHYAREADREHHREALLDRAVGASA